MNTSTGTPFAQTLVELPSLINNLLLLLSDKEKTVIKKRFNLDAKRKHTLDEIGKEFSITRERVRQIEKTALSKMRRNVFNTALKNLHDFVLSSVRTHGGFLKEEMLFDQFANAIDKNLKIDNNHLHLSFVLHDDLKCVGNTINFHPYVREEKLADYSLKHVSNQLVNQLHKYGDVKKIEKIRNDMKKMLDEADFDLKKVKSLINIDKRIALLDDDLVGLFEWRHIHPRTLRDKIMFILKSERIPLHFVDMAEKISNANFDNRNINIQAVHNELIRHDQFVLIGRGIYALAEWGYEKGTVSKVIERILSKEKELTQDKIIKEVLKKRQVKEITIVLALKNNDQFERVGRRRYKLQKV